MLPKARSLYQGDLLSNRDTRLFAWVGERDKSGVSMREHYRERYYRATRQLARLYDQEGRADHAVVLYKELLAMESTLEDVVQELYRCYAKLGDLGSLIQEDRRLRQALREMYSDVDDSAATPSEIQPETETVALFHEIREELEAIFTGAKQMR